MGKRFTALTAILLSAVIIPTVPVFAHGGHEAPPVDLGGKQTTIFVRVDPPVISGEEGRDVFVNVRFYDKDTNENFKQVTYRIWIMKDGKQIMQEWFYHPDGDLTIKIVPRDIDRVRAFGEREPQLQGLFNRAGPVVVEGPIFIERGLHNLFIEIFSVGTTRTLVEPPLQFDSWVGLAYEEAYAIEYNGETYDVKIRNFYDRVENFTFDSNTLTMYFETPFDWSRDFIEKVGMLHVEMFIPKAMSQFNSESLKGTINGFPVPVFVDTYGEEDVVVHYTVTSINLLDLADRVTSNGVSDKVVFGIAPGEESRILTTLNSNSYMVQMSWPEQILPDQLMPLALFFHDANGNRVSTATYDLILIKDGEAIFNRNGVSTQEGFASHDIMFDSQGSVTVIVDKINGSNESVEMSINVVPEFPLGFMLAIAGAFGVYLALYKRSKAYHISHNAI